VSGTADTMPHEPGFEVTTPIPPLKSSIVPSLIGRTPAFRVRMLRSSPEDTLTLHDVIAPVGPVAKRKSNVTDRLLFVIVCTPSEKLNAIRRHYRERHVRRERSCQGHHTRDEVARGVHPLTITNGLPV
jgi:hypothetical protein